MSVISRRFSFLWTIGLILWTLGASAASDYPITVHGAGEASFVPTTSSRVLPDPGKYDAVVIGGGLSGLSAALYLSDAGRKVLLLEKEANLGGLAYGGSLQGGAHYGRGAAYWTDAYEEELQILQHIGLGDFKQKFAIDEPIDSYYWNGKLYNGIWDEDTMAQLPASFALFKNELSRIGDSIPNQPIEENADMSLDRLSAAAWIRSLPAAEKQAIATERAALARHADAKLEETLKKDEAIYQRFLSDPKIDPADPMKDVVGLLDLYCRSALGSDADQVSAMAFANFYISEIDTRYTTVTGTGGAAQNMEAMLSQRPDLVTLRTSAPAVKVHNGRTGVKVTYVRDGQTYQAKASYVILAAQLKFAPSIIDGFKTARPAQAKLMSDLEYANYSVHVIFTDGHPYRSAYDTWTRPADYSEEDFTDVILGRWLDPEIKGYEGMRDFVRNPADDNGIFTIYHPLPLSLVGQGYTEDTARKIATRAVDRLLSLYQPLVDRWHQKIKIRSVETNRWPFSIHLARPGHFEHKVKILRRPFKRVFFADNNLGTPAFEEALFRGHCAADNVLLKLDPSFKLEQWTRCPVDK